MSTFAVPIQTPADVPMCILRPSAHARSDARGFARGQLRAAAHSLTGLTSAWSSRSSPAYARANSAHISGTRKSDSAFRSQPAYRGASMSHAAAHNGMARIVAACARKRWGRAAELASGYCRVVEPDPR